MLPPAKNRSLAEELAEAGDRAGAGRRLDLAHKPRGQADARSACEHDPRRSADQPIAGCLAKHLYRTRARADSPGRQLGVQPLRRSPPRVEDVVPRVAEDRARKAGQPHLREQTVDRQFVLGRNPLVEQPGASGYSVR